MAKPSSPQANCEYSRPRLSAEIQAKATVESRLGSAGGPPSLQPELTRK